MTRFLPAPLIDVYNSVPPVNMDDYDPPPDDYDPPPDG
jgi:hypothetical protein